MYHLSKKRLESTFRKLKKSPEILKEYDAVIQDQLKRGIVERVVSTNDIPGEVHYQPHHPVIRQAKTTTKVRVVYDASAKTGSNPSLNECLHAGLSLLESIPDILLRFRTNKVALVGDVEKVFIMVGITEADRDVLRFLWFDDAMVEAPTPVVLRFARVVFGVSQLSDDQCSDFTQWSSAVRVQLQQQRKLHWPQRLTFRLMCRLDPAEPPLRSPLKIPEHWLVVVRFECYRFTGT